MSQLSPICPVCQRRIAAQKKGVHRVMQESKDAKSMQAAGLTVREIADRLVVSIDRVGKLLRPSGMFGRTTHDAKRIRELWDAGESAGSIAQQVGCGIATVYRLVKPR